MKHVARGLACLCLLFVGVVPLHASAGQVYRCATSADVHRALETVGPGDTILLKGGTVYEIDATLELDAEGTDGKRIRFTSEDSSGKGRYAVITTKGGRKEPDLFAMMVRGSHWDISKIEIAGTSVPLDEGYWDTNGFQLGLYLLGPGSHDNVIEDVEIHHTHNAAVAVRDRSHHNTFRRMNIHHIGEWLSENYNAHEAEGFYIGSSKGVAEAGHKARAHDILIEESTLGPGLLGQYVDIKYAASAVTVRNNTFYCDEETYNEEIVKLAGFANVIESNNFIGSNKNLTRYIHVFNKKTADPVPVDYRGETDIPAPTGRDNTVVNNVFYTNDTSVRIVQNDLAEVDSKTFRFENNRIEPLK